MDCLQAGITGITCLNETLWIPKMEATDLRKETNEGPAIKYVGFGAAIAAELMISFWFGIGVILAIGVVDGLNHCIGALTSGK